MSVSMMAENLINLSSESDSDDEFDELILLYSLTKQKKTWKSNFMKKRQSHGEFNLSSEFSDKQFLNYFRLDRNQFNEVLHLIRDTIYSFGCNAQKPIEPEEKLAVFLR